MCHLLCGKIEVWGKNLEFWTFSVRRMLKVKIGQNSKLSSSGPWSSSLSESQISDKNSEISNSEFKKRDQS